MVKIFRQSHTEHFADAHGHEGVAPEIKVKPKRKAQHPQPRQRDRYPLHAPDPDLSEDARQAVCDHDLAGQSQDKLLQSGVEPCLVPFRRGNTLHKRLRLSERAGDQLGKHQDTSRGVDSAELAALPGIDEQGERLKGVETQPQRESKRSSRKQSGELYTGKRSRRQRQPQGKEPFFTLPFPLKQRTAQHAEKRDGAQQRKLQHLPFHAHSIEHQAARAQQRRAAFDRHKAVKDQEDREKKEKEG